VVTPDELRGIETFASLDDATLARLAAAAADITLVPGEFAVHQGDERALLAVLDGQLETVQVVDGVEQIRGRRGAGDLIGEVPLTLGTVYPAGFRAVEPSRVLRIDLKDYYAAAAQAPELAAEVGRLASYRMSGPAGLLAIASDRPASRAVVLCPRWSDAGAQLRRFLDRNQVSHTWVLSDAADAEALWGGPVRIFLVHHVTWSINSVCHFFGRRRFAVDDHSTNVAWLSLLSMGESWHHNHHTFPRSAFHGLRGWERRLDPTGWVIRAMRRMKLAWNVVEITPERQQQKLVSS